MGATFLMSYPAPTWHIRGGENFRSQGQGRTNPRAAMKEWLGLCDAITRAGGRILVMPPRRGHAAAHRHDLHRQRGRAVQERRSLDVPDLEDVGGAPAGRARAHQQVPRRGGPARRRGAAHRGRGRPTSPRCPGNRYRAHAGACARCASRSTRCARGCRSARACSTCSCASRSFTATPASNALDTARGDSVLLAHGGALVDRGAARAAHLPRQLRRGARRRRGRRARLRLQLAVRQRHACSCPTGLSTALRGTLVAARLHRRGAGAARAVRQGRRRSALPGERAARLRAHRRRAQLRASQRERAAPSSPRRYPEAAAPSPKKASQRGEQRLGRLDVRARGRTRRARAARRRAAPRPSRARSRSGSGPRAPCTTSAGTPSAASRGRRS